MLVAAARKIAGRRACSNPTRLRLPVRDASLDLITVAFGFRNLANYEAGLREMRRVLRPGGMAAILEFSQPRNALFAAVYGFYSRRILPLIGGLITGRRRRLPLPAGVHSEVPRRPRAGCANASRGVRRGVVRTPDGRKRSSAYRC